MKAIFFVYLLSNKIYGFERMGLVILPDAFYLQYLLPIIDFDLPQALNAKSRLYKWRYCLLVYLL